MSAEFGVVEGLELKEGEKKREGARESERETFSTFETQNSDCPLRGLTGLVPVSKCP